MDTRQIDLSLAKVMATYYVPEYQRLRIHHQGEDWDLLCFANPVSELLKQDLEYAGAMQSDMFSLPTYAEVWQISPSLLTSNLAQSDHNFDNRIAGVLESANASSSSRTGFLQGGNFTGQFRQPMDDRKGGRSV